jgi:hypothetical protein
MHGFSSCSSIQGSPDVSEKVNIGGGRFRNKMKTVIIIPTYWTRKKERGVWWTDIPLDHPTPIDESGTLKKAISSLDVLEDRDFSLVVMGAASSESLKEQKEKVVKEIVKSHCPKDILASVFSHSHLDLLKKSFGDTGGSEFLRLLDIHGYSNMRNLSLIIAQLLDADIVVSIDDDEYFADPMFLTKAKENIGRKVDGVRVEGVTGYYLDPSGDYHVAQRDGEWRKYWNKADAMNKTFDLLIPTHPRLKISPFALGGCMVHGRRLMEKIPYDPLVQRGEDIDYLINARLFGMHIFLDTELNVIHDPPEKPHPLWRTFMIDAIRFVYERQKILMQKEIKVRPEDLDTYPGEFLKDDLDEKIKLASNALSSQYQKEGDEDAAEIVLEIPRLANHNAMLNPYIHLLELKKNWEKLTGFIKSSGLRNQHEFFWEV